LRVFRFLYINVPKFRELGSVLPPSQPLIGSW